MYYDRQGNPIDMNEWVRLGTDDYSTVARLEEKRDDGTQVVISTVWLGIDHNFMEAGRPLIFETMVFIDTPKTLAYKRWVRENLKDGWPASSQYPGEREEPHPYDELQWRWYTEKEALEGHELVVQAFRENKDPREVVSAYLEQKRREGMI